MVFFVLLQIRNLSAIIKYEIWYIVDDIFNLFMYEIKTFQIMTFPIPRIKLKIDCAVTL